MKNQMNFQTNAKVMIEPGEELLYNSYLPRVVKGRVENCLVGVDGGSTQTRCTFFRNKDEMESLEATYVIPSAFTSLLDTKEITPDGAELYHMMDSHITNDILPPYNKFDKIRVLRGTKFVNEGGAVARINSSVQKVDTSAFYVNIIDGIAYSLIMDSSARGIPMAEMYNVSLTVSLPPDDVQSDKNKDMFAKSIQGTFSWLNLELGVEFKINVVNLKITTESESVIKCNYILSGEELPEIAMGLDGGGRSIGSSILRFGKIYPPASKTFAYGGTQLVDEVSTKYVNAKGGTKPKEDSIKRALYSGLYKRAKSTEDISDIIRESKVAAGEKLYGDIITEIFDKQDKISLIDVEAVVFSGRYFGRGDYDFSVCDIIKEKIAEISPSCEFIEIEDYMIPVGNAIIGYGEFASELDKNVVEIGRLPETVDEEIEVSVN